MSTKVTLPIGGHQPSVNDGSGFAPAIMTYDFWINSQLSIAKYSGQIRLNGHLYKLLDSGQQTEPGKWKPDLVREDWCSLYKKYGRSLKAYILKGMTPSQVRKLKKQENNELKSK